jgi:hypothetical protein
MDTTISPPRPGPLWLLAYALLGLLATACGARSSGGNATPTLISQPTPDRTVDAVVRGLATLPPLGTLAPGTPGTAAATPLRASTTQPVAPIIATPFLAPVAAATAPPALRPTIAAAPPVLASPTLAPTRAPATLAATAAPPARAPALAPEPTRAVLPTAVARTAVVPTAAPAPTRAVVPTSAPVVPTAVRPPPPAAPLPTFGRGPGAS